VVETEYESFGVDTPEDLARARYLFERLPETILRTTNTTNG